MSTKKFMIEVLKKSCGGMCLTDPENCNCFGIPTKEEIEELGIDFKEGDDFYKAEDCPHYEAEAWAYREDEDFFKDTGFVDMRDFFKNFEKHDIFSLFNIVKEKTHREPKNKPNIKVDHSEIKDKQCVYLLLTSYGVKIGKSISPITRAKTIGVKLPFKIKETKIFPVEDMTKTELFLHREYDKYRLNGEWFNLADSQINEIESYLKGIEV